MVCFLHGLWFFCGDSLIYNTWVSVSLPSPDSHLAFFPQIPPITTWAACQTPTWISSTVTTANPLTSRSHLTRASRADTPHPTLAPDVSSARLLCESSAVVSISWATEIPSETCRMVAMLVNRNNLKVAGFKTGCWKNSNPSATIWHRRPSLMFSTSFQMWDRARRNQRSTRKVKEAKKMRLVLSYQDFFYS